MREFSDEDLTAYLDGEAEAALRAEIEAALEDDQALAETLRGLSLDKAAIKSSFDAMLAQAPAFSEDSTGDRDVPARPAGFGRAAIAATALFCLLFGGLAGSLLPRQAEGTWQEFAATYHALYVEDTLSHVDRPNQVAARELERVSEALGKPLELAALTGVERLAYKRAQVLGFEERPLAQLAFLTKAGEPVALCIFAKGGAASAALEVETIQGMSAALWAKDGFEFLLVGGQDDGLIRDAAETFLRSL